MWAAMKGIAIGAILGLAVIAFASALGRFGTSNRGSYLNPVHVKVLGESNSSLSKVVPLRMPDVLRPEPMARYAIKAASRNRTDAPPQRCWIHERTFSEFADSVTVRCDPPEGK